MSARQPEICAATIGSSGRNERERELCAISVEMVGDTMCLYDGPSDVVYVEKRRGPITDP